MNAPLAKEQIALLMSDSLTYRVSPVQWTEGTLAGTPPSIFERLRFWLAGAVAYIVELPRRRAVLDELSQLSDRELADIGLSRTELTRVFDPQFRNN